jgi:hypothetical protein
MTNGPDGTGLKSTHASKIVHTLREQIVHYGTKSGSILCPEGGTFFGSIWNLSKRFFERTISVPFGTKL